MKTIPAMGVWLGGGGGCGDDRLWRKVVVGLDTRIAVALSSVAGHS